jgi:hypothetical protein
MASHSTGMKPEPAQIRLSSPCQPPTKPPNLKDDPYSDLIREEIAIERVLSYA